MIFKNPFKKNFKVRRSIETFLFLPVIYKGRLHWFSQVKLEKSYNGYRMMIINIEKI